MYRIREDENIPLYLLNVSPGLIIFQFENLLRNGVWGKSQRNEISFPFFPAFSATFSSLIKNWRGCGKLLLGKGSKAVKPFHGYIKYFKAQIHKMLRQYITKGKIFEMGSGAKPQQKFLTLHIEIIRTLRHIFVKCFNFISI